MSILECWLFFKAWKKTFYLRGSLSLEFSKNLNLRSPNSAPLLESMYISNSCTGWSLSLSCDEQTWFSSSCLAIVQSIQSFWSRRLMLLHSTPWKMVLNHQLGIDWFACSTVSKTASWSFWMFSFLWAIPFDLSFAVRYYLALFNRLILWVDRNESNLDWNDWFRLCIQGMLKVWFWHADFPFWFFH